MTARVWLAIITAPISSAAVYAWLTLVSLPATGIPERPTVTSLVVLGVIAGLVFELAVLVPLFLTLLFGNRPWGPNPALQRTRRQAFLSS